MRAPIAVLGAGAMGSAAAVLLARHADEVELVVLDVDVERAEGAAERAGAAARRVDVVGGELAEALSGFRAVAACLPYRLNLEVMAAALAAGVHYADLGGLFHVTLRQLELHERFRDAGLSAVLGIGSAPGLTNVLARHGADRLDAVGSIDIADGAVDLASDDAFGVPYSADTILDEFTEPAMIFENGELREVPAGSGMVEWEFPDPVGRQPAMYTLHSEPATLPETISGVRDVRWRLALPHAVHEGFALLVGIGLASRERVHTPAGEIAPRDVLAAVLDRMPGADGPPQDVEFLDVRVAGTVEGREAVVRELARFDPSPEGLSAGAFGTAIPIAQSIRWQAAGRVVPGVHPPETAFDADAFLDELASEGVGLTVEGP